MFAGFREALCTHAQRYSLRFNVELVRRGEGDAAPEKVLELPLLETQLNDMTTMVFCSAYGLAFIGITYMKLSRGSVVVETELIFKAETAPSAKSVEEFLRKATSPDFSLDKNSVKVTGVFPPAPAPPEQGGTTSDPEQGGTTSDPEQGGTTSDPGLHTGPELQKEYPLTNNPRGKCLIINNKNFAGGNYRSGTQEDEKELRSVFSMLGFIVETHPDLTAQGIRALLDKEGGGNFSKADALVVCVLSHGNEGCVSGSDGGKVSLKQLRKPFRSSNARSLAGKPKLFFIQACQGSGYQKGLLDDLEVDDDDDYDDDDDSQPKVVADYADFLWGISTVEGFKAIRNKITGSYYIQELCKQLIAAAERGGESIVDILTNVNKEVGSEVHRVRGNDTIQEPEYKSSLHKKLKLTFPI